MWLASGVLIGRQPVLPAAAVVFFVAGVEVGALPTHKARPAPGPWNKNLGCVQSHSGLPCTVPTLRPGLSNTLLRQRGGG